MREIGKDRRQRRIQSFFFVSFSSHRSGDGKRGWVSHPDVVFVVDETTMGRKGEVKGTFWMHYVEGEVGGSGEYGRR